MGIRRSGKGYEEMDGANVPNPNPNGQPHPHPHPNGLNNNLPMPEFELASVTVVPDGKLKSPAKIVPLNNRYNFSNRHLYCDSSCERFRIWMVPNTPFVICWVKFNLNFVIYFNTILNIAICNSPLLYYVLNLFITKFRN